MSLGDANDKADQAKKARFLLDDVNVGECWTAPVSAPWAAVITISESDENVTF